MHISDTLFVITNSGTLKHLFNLWASLGKKSLMMDWQFSCQLNSKFVSLTFFLKHLIMIDYTYLCLRRKTKGPHPPLDFQGNESFTRSLQSQCGYYVKI